MPRLLYTRILSGDTLYKSLYAYTQIPVDEEEYTRTVRCAFVAERKMRLRDGRWASQRNDFFFNRLKMWRVRFLADEVDLDLFVVSSSEISLSPPFWDRGRMDGWIDPRFGQCLIPSRFMRKSCTYVQQKPAIKAFEWFLEFLWGNLCRKLVTSDSG